MAEWLTAEHRLALIRRYGTEGPKTPEQMAIEEACELSSDVRELWDTRGNWSVHDDEFSQLLWPRVLRAIGIMGDTAADPETPSSPELPTTRAEPHDDTVRITVPFALAEKAVQLHRRDELGRRKLEAKLPGLGDWSARWTLYWYEVGEPSGLWLDDDDRLRWGPAIIPIWDREQDREQRGRANAPTPAALRLPRL